MEFAFRNETHGQNGHNQCKFAGFPISLHFICLQFFYLYSSLSQLKIRVDILKHVHDHGSFLCI